MIYKLFPIKENQLEYTFTHYFEILFYKNFSYFKKLLA